MCVATAPARVGTRYMDALAGEKCKVAGKAPSSKVEGSRVSKRQHPVSAVSLWKNEGKWLWNDVEKVAFWL